MSTVRHLIVAPPVNEELVAVVAFLPVTEARVSASENDVRYVFVSNANVPAAVIFTNEVDA